MEEKYQRICSAQCASCHYNLLRRGKKLNQTFFVRAGYSLRTCFIGEASTPKQSERTIFRQGQEGSQACTNSGWFSALRTLKPCNSSASANNVSRSPRERLKTRNRCNT
jgi:hypothetical protein